MTQLQQVLLQTYRNWRDLDLTLASLYRQSLGGHLLVAAYFIIVTAVCFYWEAWWQGAMLIGIAIGFELRDFNYARRSVVIWPVMRVVIDWQRVDDLLGDPKLPPSAKDS